MSVSTVPGAFTVAEASAKAHCSTWSIYRAVERGELRAKRIGRALRILDEDLAAWLRSDVKAAS
jgi:excisionase family DNA binding protein